MIRRFTALAALTTFVVCLRVLTCLFSAVAWNAKNNHCPLARTVTGVPW